MTKKIGILGGAFNPIHMAHIEIAEAVLNNLNYDEIWFLVSFNPPHKELINEKDFIDRCNMVKLAISYNNKFVLKDLEQKLYNDKVFDTNSSYNVMTYLTNEYKDCQFSLILGYDELLNIKTFKNYQELLNNFGFVFIKRINYNVDTKYLEELKKDYNIKYDLIDTNITDCSATEIRKEIKNNKYSKYLNKEVLDYIIKYNLYS